jgi:hypothetical protein
MSAIFQLKAKTDERELYAPGEDVTLQPFHQTGRKPSKRWQLVQEGRMGSFTRRSSSVNSSETTLSTSTRISLFPVANPFQEQICEVKVTEIFRRTSQPGVIEGYCK